LVSENVLCEAKKLIPKMAALRCFRNKALSMGSKEKKVA
jgi:hypothetical protein